VCGKRVAKGLRGKVAVMLRITVRNEIEITRFVVEGKLAGACVCELERCWQATKSDESQGAILVDLSSVTFIDASGKELLSRMHEKGIRFVATSLMPRCFIEEIESSKSDC